MAHLWELKVQTNTEDSQWQKTSVATLQFSNLSKDVCPPPQFYGQI